MSAFEETSRSGFSLAGGNGLSSRGPKRRGEAPQLIGVKAGRRRGDNNGALSLHHRPSTVKPKPPPLTVSQRPRSASHLRRDITLLLALKLLAIIVLWSLFVRPQRISIDSQRAGDSVLGTPAPAATPPPSSIRP